MQTPFFFGANHRMKDLEHRIGAIARSGLPVLIEGPSGAGKEALAELLHELSGVEGGFGRILCRQSGPVMLSKATANGTADLGALWRTTRGTLFLKNIPMLSAVAQEQLLMALEQMADTRHGSSESKRARLISSATEPLEALEGWREFNPGLYYKVSVYRLTLPSLRERSGDIPEMFEQMVRRASNGAGAPSTPTRLIDALLAYGWPGNLSELYNVARRYVVTGDPDEIIAELGCRPRVSGSAVRAEPSGLSLKEQVKGASQKLESEIILRTLERHRWNRRRAAETLKISYRSLLYRMKGCNLRIDPQAAHEEE